MKRKPIIQNHDIEIKKVFVWKWTKCGCGCNEEHMFEMMWEVKTPSKYAYGDTYSDITYYSTKEFKTIDDLNHHVNIILKMKTGTIEDLEEVLTEEDYYELPYNKHLFMINLNTNGISRVYYIMRIQEFKGCEVHSMSLSDAERMIEESRIKFIHDSFINKTKIPLPQEYDKDFKGW